MTPSSGPPQKPRWLAFDLGPQFGDNFRGLVYLKALKQKHPQADLTVWITPELQAGLGGLFELLDFVDHWLVRPRPVRDSYQINLSILKVLAAQKQKPSLDTLPGGEGPDGVAYDKIIPTAEPWFTAKLMLGEPLDAPDPVNQGEFLGRLLVVSGEEAGGALPLFGRRGPVGDHICVGLSRPRADDPKQPAPGLIGQAWEALLGLGQEILALDHQDWRPPPDSPLVTDLRLAPWEDKIEPLNQARIFVGLDGGLNHFAAACGCPTLSFYGADGGPEHGRLVGPCPRVTPFGAHAYYSRFDGYLAAIQALAK